MKTVKAPATAQRPPTPAAPIPQRKQLAMPSAQPTSLAKK